MDTIHFADDDELETIDETARALKSCRSAVYLLIKNGKLPVVKLGRSTRIRRGDRRSLVHSLRVGAAA